MITDTSHFGKLLVWLWICGKQDREKVYTTALLEERSQLITLKWAKLPQFWTEKPLDIREKCSITFKDGEIHKRDYIGNLFLGNGLLFFMEKRMDFFFSAVSTDTINRG